MPDAEQTLGYLEQQIPSLSAAAVDVAYWQALATGQAVLVSGEGGIYEAHADGTKKLGQTSRQTSQRPRGHTGDHPLRQQVLFPGLFHSALRGDGMRMHHNGAWRLVRHPLPPPAFPLCFAHDHHASR